MKIVEREHLEYRNRWENSYKEYNVEIIETNSKRYHVAFSYGRIGSDLQHGTKTKYPVSLSKAEAIYYNLIDAKRNKGYL